MGAKASSKKAAATADAKSKANCEALDLFHEPVSAWFKSALGDPTNAQSQGWPPIAAGQSALLLAPTGSGKTLAAFLAAIDRLMFSPDPQKAERCRVLYVSPLKALAVDVERNLRAPLVGIAEAAVRLEATVRAPTVEIRTGDTPQIDRARMRRNPPDILITTPESLFLILTSGARSMLAGVDTVIIDEIHQLVPSKRGAHLFLSLERLEAMFPRKKPLQRIGLSATQKPLDEVARLLGGFEGGAPRPVTIVDAGAKKKLELRVEVPNVDLGALGREDPQMSFDPTAPSRRTIWPHVHKRVVELVRQHRSTMIFTNSRRLSERFAAAINELAGEEIALAHHGSVAHKQRALMEDRLKRGDLPAIVATSSLELGIDMGAVDLVVQIESPASVASGMQRVGRASHGVGGVPRGVLFPKHRADVIACAAAVSNMHAGEVEETRYPRNALDVLSQQIVAIVSDGPIDIDALFDLVRRAAPYADLPRAAYEGVLDMLSGRYPSDDFSGLKPRVTWDRLGRKVVGREGAKRLAVQNAGTIPDRGLYGVFLPGDGKNRTGGKRVGELDEEMVFELREGEVFVLGASSWRADEISHDRVIVSPAAGEPGKMPFWHGDNLGRARGLGMAVGELTRTVARMKPDEALTFLKSQYALDESAADNLVRYVHEQVEATGEVPSDRTFVVERYKDDIGDWRVCVLSPLGLRIHAPWSTAIATRLREAYAGEIDVHYTDEGMAFRIPACDAPPPAELFFPASDEIESLVTEALAETSLFAARFRECAGRALLLPRKSPQKRSPLWAIRKRAADLLAVATRFTDFPIVLEAYRECLRDVFDLPGLVETLRHVEDRRLRVVTVDTRVPSPFAASLTFSYVAGFIYAGDAPLAERRAQALLIDHAQLRELLGEIELRRLLDPEAIEETERTLQGFLYPAKSADGVHDLLLRIGDLTLDEVRTRTNAPDAAEAWLDELVLARRVIRVAVGGASRFVAAEDAAAMRDALGVPPPRGLPAAFLEPVTGALLRLVSRYARTHGPFVAKDVAARFGIGVSPIETALGKLLSAGKVVEGAFLPQGTTQEHCDKEVLATIRRKSLARLRREVEPVDGAAYARLLADWHSLVKKRRGPDALMAAIGQLEGCPLVASVLEAEILPARVEGYKPWDLDALTASGEVVWAGVESLGPNDGRIALFLADHEPLLAQKGAPPEGPLLEAIRALLARRGAVFFAEIARTVGGFPSDALEALWDLVWAGEVTNDTLEPLRSRIAAQRDNQRKGRPRPRTRTRSGPPGSEGRWSLRSARWPSNPSDTERRTALTRTLLERYGVLTREVAQTELIPGGFSAVYEVLKTMEDAGRVRRGYFLAGHGGAQFAYPGADDRLRALAHDEDNEPWTLVLAATDPANPYGATLPWPETKGDARPQRASGALVVLHDGAVLGWLGRTEQTLITFLPAESPDREHAARTLAKALGALIDEGRKRALLLVTIDGDEGAKSPLAEVFAEAGFGASSRGLFRRRARE